MFMSACWQIYIQSWFSWGGRSPQDICSALTKVDAFFWQSNTDECAMVIHRHFLSVYIPCRNIVLMLAALWYAKHFSALFFCHMMTTRPKYVYFDNNNMVVL
jgi:7-cyano-7-deazaguanine synthase in queuosine biosynthesis